MHSRLLHTLLWILFILLAIIAGLYPALYFVLDRKFSLLAFKDNELLASKLWNTTFYLHILTGGIALLIGWVQFAGGWRRKYPAFHRAIGWLYTLCALPAAASGIGLSGSATGGLVSQAGFALLGIFWFAVTYMALQYAGNNRILRHRQMALYSYAACFAAATLRLWLQLFLYLGMDFLVAYRIVSWLCWIPNIVVAFVLNRRINHTFARMNNV